MFTIFFLITIFLLDVFVLITLFKTYKHKKEKKKIIRFHISSSLVFLLFLLVYRYAIDRNGANLALRQTIALCFMWVYFTKLLACLIFWAAWAGRQAYKKILPTPTQASSQNMTRAQFLERTALATGGLSLGLGLLGTNYNLYDYQIHRVTLRLPRLPKALHGLRIAQISDLHTGSLTNKLAVKGGLEMLLREKADLICVTGDLVNYETTEIHDFEPLLAKLKAPLGVFSCLGNHDYGDYRSWSSPQAKQKNLQALIEAQKQFGWKLLIDTTQYIDVQGEKIAIIGVGNWSKIGRFPRYGDLSKAYQMVNEQASTQILLSHDPTHWDAQVRPQTPKIDLMLAGHTHGMQMGIEWGNFRFSPSQLIFEQWAGLYQKGEQYLYVNRGFGYSDAFPLRLGILPEITVFTLST